MNSYCVTYRCVYKCIKNISGLDSVLPTRAKVKVKTIRIFNRCELLIENSVMRVTVRHHEVRLMMPSSYPSDRIFNLHRRTIMDSFSCILFL